ncbi:hypothetical protein SAMN04488540_12540 [Ferrimonas sediminum]|uniref:Lipoprotein n=1 Tax=Ferrimonas sediminum TaxID=718193 RepID=A0A1G9AX97_9GAMM|nr:hypothetical protein [Ferrimonas sediminum]SDK31504.1 hypothetical protein SAMN04488540_12540 [Ferrimonas sediminum]
MRRALVGSVALILTACASHDDQQGLCGELSTFHQPPETENLFRAVVTRIDDTNVVTKASYRLAPGTHTLRVVELIDDPRLGISLRDRHYKEFTLRVEAGVEYHLGARFETPVEVPSSKTDYWQPVVWKQEPVQCHLEP